MQTRFLMIAKTYSIFVIILFAIFFSFNASQAATFYANDFNANTSGLSMGSNAKYSSTGGINNSGAIYVHYTYNNRGTAGNAIGLKLGSFSGTDYWVQFYSWISGKPAGGSKYLKFFGDTCSAGHTGVF
jgi:hypothetical protein